MQLDWYLTDWTQTTNTIDYQIESVTTTGGKTTVALQRKGLMPMPIDLEVTYADGSREQYYIPLKMMYGNKPEAAKMKILPDWGWGHPGYTFSLAGAKKPVKITLDPSGRMADVKPEDNSWTGGN